MDLKARVIFSLFLILGVRAYSQKPFAEGIIHYKVTLGTEDHQVINGTYTFIIKGSHIRKEIKLDNGYEDVLLIDCGSNKVYSLQVGNGKKYAVELSMSELMKNQDRYKGFVLENEHAGQRSIAGCSVFKGNIKYKDGSNYEIYYTREWEPSEPVTFERFPGPGFFPLYFSYKNENNLSMEFEAENITPGPIENAMFRIPPDYKMISNAEYKELNR
jgi:hypothetical protein